MSETRRHDVMLACGKGLWRCPACKAQGSLGVLQRTSCTAAPPSTLTPTAQLQAWADGKSQCPNTSGECCPDFSCCKPNLLAPEPMRRAYLAAPQEQREKMLMSVLSNMVDDVSPKTNVHITRGEPEKDQPS